jgi:NMD protein affecting ribosome stability and mRNA decay
MILCRRCTKWKGLSDYPYRATTAVCRDCLAPTKPATARTAKKPFGTHPQPGTAKAREKLEQAIARVDAGDSPGYAAHRVGVRIDVLEKELERRGAA